MNAMAQIKMPRSVESVDATLQGERRFLDDLVRLSCEFHDCDTRPLIIYDGHIAERVGPSPVPDTLTDMIIEQKSKIAHLEVELHEASARYSFRRDSRR
jgi:hypothetical protein